MVDTWGEWKLQRQDTNIFMHYMPEENLVACGCGKCGSTSMWHYIYEKKFGHPWNYTGEPYAQDVTSERWEGKVIHEKDMDNQSEIMKNAGFKFALVRDPKERLISSWKSKVACNGDLYGTDVGTREFFTQRLLETAGNGRSSKVPCLSLEDFLETLQKVHSNQKERFLDRHFLPQTEGCFSRFSPGNWSMIATISDPQAFSKLGEALGSYGNPAPYEHASTSQVQVTERSLELLNNITAKEYELLGDHLQPQKIVSAGVYMQMPNNDLNWFSDMHLD
eukprot:CAMPEP_0170593374 /NCGR_PEP_ID=MMETSP0224-20130122/13413_1 /TAXON_ID=285029 /ORGANISM="Togula jolla, Strain CCCM 725" /LENGTH=277 /DNA_ID=CAMNT_0010917321 /DNA_START=208 /DNA_END=1041 /DNA_ORIENTATION=+